MRSLIVLAALLLSGSALASEYVWGLNEAPATRWIEASTKEVGKLQPKQRLEVLFREGSRIRVRLSGATFGWVDQSAVTTTAPEGADAAPGPGGGLDGLQLDGLPPGLNLEGLKLE
jgi:hypothetical protein